MRHAIGIALLLGVVTFSGLFAPPCQSDADFLSRKTEPVTKPRDIAETAEATKPTLTMFCPVSFVCPPCEARKREYPKQTLPFAASFVKRDGFSLYPRFEWMGANGKRYYYPWADNQATDWATVERYWKATQ